MDPIEWSHSAIRMNSCPERAPTEGNRPILPRSLFPIGPFTLQPRGDRVGGVGGGLLQGGGFIGEGAGVAEAKNLPQGMWQLGTRTGT